VRLGLQRFALRRSIAAPALVGALLVALIVGLVFGGAFGIPFMAVAVIAGVRPKAKGASPKPCPA
jgi:hypothetical protein